MYADCAADDAEAFVENSLFTVLESCLQWVVVVPFKSNCHTMMVVILMLFRGFKGSSGLLLYLYCDCNGKDASADKDVPNSKKVRFLFVVPLS